MSLSLEGNFLLFSAASKAPKSLFKEIEDLEVPHLACVVHTSSFHCCGGCMLCQELLLHLFCDFSADFHLLPVRIACSFACMFGPRMFLTEVETLHATISILLWGSLGNCQEKFHVYGLCQWWQDCISIRTDRIDKMTTYQHQQHYPSKFFYDCTSSCIPVSLAYVLSNILLKATGLYHDKSPSK